MKAILQHGQFSCMIDVVEAVPIISIRKPPNMNILPMEETFGASIEKNKILDFKIDRQLRDDILIYSFMRER